MKKRILAFILAVVTVAAMSVPVFAVSENRTATLAYRNIKITLNDKEFTPKDAAGNVVDPFIIDGTTYLPVRAVSEALGLNVEWDGANFTVKLSGQGSAALAISSPSEHVGLSENRTAELAYRDIKITLNGVEIIPKDAAGNIVEPFIIDGTTYLPVRAVSEALGLNVEWDGANFTVKLAEPGYTSPAPTQAPSGNYGPHRDRSPDTVVYVSNRSHTIHSVHDCSGMKNYKEMTIADAEAKGYEYCPNCW